mmetsp:Transcript_31001/g.73644  ORF Transcript_31001/g.73644 Transcript_31001/m.73644 type:complete len:338 (+) Transcript_31001:996-2009(+)
MTPLRLRPLVHSSSERNSTNPKVPWAESQMSAMGTPGMPDERPAPIIAWLQKSARIASTPGMPIGRFPMYSRLCTCRCFWLAPSNPCFCCASASWIWRAASGFVPGGIAAAISAASAAACCPASVCCAAAAAPAVAPPAAAVWRAWAIMAVKLGSRPGCGAGGGGFGFAAATAIRLSLELSLLSSERERDLSRRDLSRLSLLRLRHFLLLRVLSRSRLSLLLLRERLSLRSRLRERFSPFSLSLLRDRSFLSRLPRAEPGERERDRSFLRSLRPLFRRSSEPSFSFSFSPALSSADFFCSPSFSSVPFFTGSIATSANSAIPGPNNAQGEDRAEIKF